MLPKVKTDAFAEAPSLAGARNQKSFYWALAAIVTVFGAIRFACLFNDLWLDEIWSLRLVGPLSSPAEILTRLTSDNNHPLNSLWLYLVGPGRAEWTYRLLSWIMGTASVALAGAIARRQILRLHPVESSGLAAAAGLCTAALVGGSYFLIHYSSEARGYAPAVGFCFLAVYALGHARERAASPWGLVFGLACVLGLLAHLVAFQVMLGGLVWSLMALWTTWSNWRDRLAHLACWHLAPWLFLAVYYLGFVRYVEIGGGPKLALVEVLGTLSAFTLGLPGNFGVIALSIFLAVTIPSLGQIGRRDRALLGFFVTAIFVAPAIGISSSRFVLLYPRYFVVSATLTLLLVGYALARVWNRGGLGRWISLSVLAGFLVGNGIHAARLLRDGRGQYQAALRYVGEHSPAGAVTVSSDSDFRNFMVMDYYAKSVGPGHHLQYYPTNQTPPGGLQWVFLHRLDESTPIPPDALHDAEGRNYQLARTFPHAQLSGFEWYVYRNLDPAVLPPSAR